MNKQAQGPGTLINLRNSETEFGLVALVMHWLMAMLIVGLFGLGLWMVELDYYSEWYKTGPDIHRGFGVIVLFLLLFRLAFRLWNPPPIQEASLRRWEGISAVIMHWTLYLGIFVVIVSGYLISTADGRSVAVFNWFEIPATISSVDNQEDIFGSIHFYVATALLVLSGLHTAAAFKHHFIDKDGTLKRILGLPGQPI